MHGEPLEILHALAFCRPAGAQHKTVHPSSVTKDVKADFLRGLNGQLLFSAVCSALSTRSMP